VNSVKLGTGAAEDKTAVNSIKATDAAAAADQDDALTRLVAQGKITIENGTIKTTASGNAEVTVTLERQVYLEVEALESNTTGTGEKSIKLDVTPKYNLVATISNDKENPITVDTAREAVVTDTVTITLDLPEGFATETSGSNKVAYIRHTHVDANGNENVYVYVGNVVDDTENDKQVLTFTNKYGFSELEISNTNPAEASYNGTYYDTLQGAVDEVSNNGTIYVLKASTPAKVSGTKYFKVVNQSGTTVDITAASGYGLWSSGEMYFVWAQGYSIGSVGSGGSSGGSLEAGGSVNSTTLEFENGTTAVVSENEGGIVTAEVSVPEGVEKTTVVIPVANMTAGTVAVDANGKVVKLSVPTEDGMAVTVTESTTLTFVDNSRTFTDVAEDYWGAESIAFASAHELFKSTGDDVSFEPELELNRYMMMTILARLDDQNLNDTGATWYTDGMEWAMEKGISDGYNGTRNVTREEMVTMLWRYAGKPAAENDNASKFADVGSVSEYAQDAIAWAVSVGIINGGDNGIDPQGDATRAQVAAVMQRYCALLTK
jgi:hypothetical protein